MRLRYRSISYTVGRTPASLERHYRELREAMLRAGQHYGLQPGVPWRPPIDIHETPEAIQVKIELAGVREEDIDVTLYENALVVSGERQNDVSPDEFVYYHEAQVRYGPFRADVLLPFPVERDEVAATYEAGFLRVRLPKAQPTKVTARGEGAPRERTDNRPDGRAADESDGGEPGDGEPGGADEGETSRQAERNGLGVATVGSAAHATRLTPHGSRAHPHS